MIFLNAFIDNSKRPNMFQYMSAMFEENAYSVTELALRSEKMVEIN